MTIALDNVVAVVTGAAGGIGRELVKAMKAANAVVIAADMVASADIAGADHYLQLDVTSEEGWAALADLVQREYGRLDALVHNAGISTVRKFEETPLAEWHRVNSVNVDAIVIGTQALLPLLKEGGKARAGGASVVNFSSVGGLRGAAFNAAYCTSKAAVKMLSKWIDTGMLNSIFERYVELGVGESVDAIVAGNNVRHPIGRIGRPEEMGGGVVYLCSDAASFVTCTEFVMDGGYTAV